MLADDAALEDVVYQQGLLAALPEGSIHICAGTHGIPVIRKIKKAHADKGYVLVCAPMMGRPEMVSSGTAGVFASGPADAMAKCKPLFDVLARRTFEGGSEPEAATAMKIANNFVLGCAIEAMGEGFSLTRKYGVAQSVFYDVMTDGLWRCLASRTPTSRSMQGSLPRCRCRAATSGAIGWSAPSPTATATRTGR